MSLHDWKAVKGIVIDELLNCFRSQQRRIESGTGSDQRTPTLSVSLLKVVFHASLSSSCSTRGAHHGNKKAQRQVKWSSKLHTIVKNSNKCQVLTLTCHSELKIFDCKKFCWINLCIKTFLVNFPTTLPFLYQSK